MENAILDRIHGFEQAHGRTLTVGAIPWRYYRLGHGPALVWLTGGLRRTALGYAFLENLAEHFTVLSPDYAPVLTAVEMLAGIEAIRQAEGIEDFVLCGQSYGGMVAQAYLATHPDRVSALVLSSSGPMDYAPAAARVDRLLAFLCRVLPEATVKRLFYGMIRRIVSGPPGEQDAWREAIHHVVTAELARQDFVSFFAVAGDLILKRVVRPEVLAGWRGRLIVPGAENDPTQGKKDPIRYERLFGRPAEMVSTGSLGHTALLADPQGYAGLLVTMLLE